MADLEERIGQWRHELAEALGGSAEALAELEDHLRDEVARLVQAGQPAEQAFAAAAGKLGSPPALAAELARGEVPAPWLPVRIAVVGLIAGTGWLVGFLNAQDLLLGAYVVAITLGYTTTLTIGVLAARYVLARPFGRPDPRQMQGLFRATRMLTGAALAVTVLGVVLGGFWAQDRLGRFWGWDARETAAALVLLWDAVAVVVLTRRLLSEHHAVLLGLAGSTVVALAWFGPVLLGSGLHSYGYAALGLPLCVFVLAQAALAGLGWAPAGCLRRRSARVG